MTTQKFCKADAQILKRGNNKIFTLKLLLITFYVEEKRFFFSLFFYVTVRFFDTINREHKKCIK